MLINNIYNIKIRFHFFLGLVFSFLLLGCSEKKRESNIVTIEWEGNKARRLLIPLELVSGTPRDSLELLLQIQLKNSPASMLGEVTLTKDTIIFQPLIAFTPGLKYQIRLANTLLHEIEIPTGYMRTTPAVVSIYPSADTLPLNLLKIYIEFSKPMEEGRALENIAVIKNGKDTIPSIFLDLQPELWNQERTMLTCWLDPGRIKRDLQPNKKWGSPLEQGASYQIVVKQDWRDAEGVSLPKTYHKDFIVGFRDSVSPDPRTWRMDIPKAGSKQSLKILLNEPLDYLLLKNAIRIMDTKGNVLNGVIDTKEEETIFHFTPFANWIAGNYTCEIEARLEDLAGNNLNRLFDKDLTRENTGVQKEIYKRAFHIQ